MKKGSLVLLSLPLLLCSSCGETGSVSLSDINGIWRFGSFDSQGTLTSSNENYFIEIKGSSVAVYKDSKVYLKRTAKIENNVYTVTNSDGVSTKSVITLKDFGFLLKYDTGNFDVCYPYLNGVYTCVEKTSAGDSQYGGYTVQVDGVQKYYEYKASSPYQSFTYSYDDGVYLWEDTREALIFNDNGFTALNSDSRTYTFTRFFDGKWIHQENKNDYLDIKNGVYKSSYGGETLYGYTYTSIDNKFTIHNVKNDNEWTYDLKIQDENTFVIENSEYGNETYVKDTK